MNLHECIKFANENPLCYLATVYDDKPFVRAMGFWFADETGFYFQTGAIKDLFSHLKDNPNAEVCYYKHDEMSGKMLRIAGKVEFLNDISLKERAINDRPFLKNFGFTADNPNLIVFRIAHGNAHFWTMENNLKPKEYIEF